MRDQKESQLAGSLEFKKLARLQGYTPPKTSRGRETLDRLLDEVEHWLEQGSFDSIAIDELLARCGVTTGSFYFRFQSKDALRLALLERYLRGVDQFRVFLRQLDEASDDSDFRSVANAIIEYQVARYANQRALLRHFRLEYNSLDRRSAAFASQIANILVKDIETVLGRRLQTAGSRHGRKWARQWSHVINALCREFVVLADAPALGGTPYTPLQAKRLVNEVSTAFLDRIDRT